MSPAATRRIVARAAALALLVVALTAVLVVALRGAEGSYSVHARFRDAGQLVVGDQVQVGGHAAGSVEKITITDRGVADIRLKIDDAGLRPLHQGTRMSIGSPGLSGVANRYVRVVPGPGDGPEISDGGVVGLEQTQGIVDLDTLIDALGKPSRKRLQVILRESADIFDAPVAGRLNSALAVFNPALSRTNALGAEIVRDQRALETLLQSTAAVSSTLAGRRGELGDSITNTAKVLSDVASQRRALQDTLARSPGVLRQATGVLARTSSTLTDVNPAVRHLRPTAEPAARLLRQVIPVARDTRPAIASIRKLLPLANRTLAAFPALARTTVPALVSAVDAFTGLQPIVTGLRAYTPDLLAGFFEGFGGNQSGYYDANGHYARIALNAAGAGSLPGAGGLGASSGYQTGLTRRCPGAASEPAPDGSNPFVPPDVKDLCDPDQNPKP